MYIVHAYTLKHTYTNLLHAAVSHIYINVYTLKVPRSISLKWWIWFVDAKLHVRLNDRIRCAYSWIMMRMIDTLSKLISFSTFQYRSEGIWDSIWDHRTFTVWNVAPTCVYVDVYGISIALHRITCAIYRFIIDEVHNYAYATESNFHAQTHSNKNECRIVNKIIDIIVA